MSQPTPDPQESPVPGTRRDDSRTVLDQSETLLEPGGPPRTGSGLAGTSPDIRDHELLTRVGRGSYGEVWLARNVMGTYRAVKIVYRATFEHERPFEREFNGIKKFEPISRSHDGFVDILQVGRTDDYFYYVMELADDQVTGPEIDPDQYAPKSLHSELREHRRLPFQKCVELGISLTQALGRLHHYGLIHRDIKPSNIIFVNGIPKLADIGLVAEQSEAKSFVGTAGFIPPEGPGTPQADIYSLGKVLYEIATGKDRHEFPELPTLMGEEATDTHLLELNSVFLKACQTDVKLRYQTAEEMRDDLLLLQSGKSVKRAQAAERRLAALMKVSLVGITITILAFAGIYVVNRQAKREAGLRQTAQRNLINQYVTSGNHSLDEGDLGEAVGWYVKALEIETDPAAAARHRLRIGSALSLAPKLVQVMKHDDVVNDVVFSPDGRLLASASDDRTARIWSSVTGAPAQAPLLHSNKVLRVIFSPDNRRLLTIGGELEANLNTPSAGTGEVKLWEVITGRLLADVPHPNYVTAAEFSKDGSVFATGCYDGAVRLCDGETGAIRQTIPHSAAVLALGLSGDGKMLVTSSDDARLRLWDVPSGACRFTNLISGAGPAVVISQEGRFYGGSSQSSGMALYSTEDGRVLHNFMGPNSSRGGTLALGPEGRRLLAGTWDQRFRVFDVESGLQMTALNYAPKSTDPDMSYGAEFSPDGRLILTWMQDGTARVWSSTSGNQAFCPLHHSGSVTMARFSSDSRRIATAGMDGLVKVWDLATDDSLEFASPNQNGAGDARWSPDGRRLFVPSGIGTGQAFDPTSGQPVGPRMLHQANPYGSLSGTWSKNGKCFLSADGAGTIRLWDGQRLTPLTDDVCVFTNQAAGAELSPDGTIVAVTGTSQVTLLDVATAIPRFTIPSLSERVIQAGFSSRGHWLYTRGLDGYVRVWNATNGALCSDVIRHKGFVTQVCCSSDDRWLATASSDGTARVWQLPGGEAVSVPLRHNDRVWSVAFSPDNQKLLTACADGTARLWNIHSGINSVRLEHGVPVVSASFSRDGRYIASACSRGARLWDAAIGEPLSPWLPAGNDGSSAYRIEFSPIDDRFVTSRANTARIWQLLPDSRPLFVLQAHALLVGGPSTTVQTEAWDTLVREARDSVTVSVNRALRWHRAIAQSCQGNGDAFALEKHTDALLAADPGDSVGRRWRALALLYLGHARDALALDAEVIPARPANASPAALDLTLFYNSRVDEGEFDMSGNGSGFVPGLRTLAGVAFDVRGGILLGGLATLGQLNPARVAISFKGYALRLHMLQYAMFDTTDGSLVGRYVLRYRNGERRELPIRYGIDVRNWWHGQSIGDKDDRLAEATVAWEGHQRGASTYGASIRFFKRTYENPLPEIEITSIDFESTMATPCAPVLLAITVEGGTQDKQPPASR